MRPLILCLILTGCGALAQRDCYLKGERCHPSDGRDGQDGRPGKDGTSCSVTQEAYGAMVTCTDGTQAYVWNGINGRDGINGTNGMNGQDGAQGSQGEKGDTGAQGTQGEKGEKGDQGLPGVDGINIVPVVLCPETSGSYPEVALCIDNNLYAVYNENPTRTRFVLIPAGQYQTTDGRHCTFTVTSACNITY